MCQFTAVYLPKELSTPGTTFFMFEAQFTVQHRASSDGSDPILRIFFWLGFSFHVRLCPSDYAAHTSTYLNQGTTAHDVHGCLLWSAVRPTLRINFIAVLPAGKGCLP